MAHPHTFNQVQIIGDCFNQQEIWTTGFSMGFPDQDAPVPTVADAEFIANAWTDFFTNTGSGVTTSYRTLAVKYNQLGNDGRQITDPTVEYVYPTPVGGPAQTNLHPPQCTMVLSLRAAQTRGLATKGRMYLPLTGFSIETSGKANPARIGTSLALLQTFFQTLGADTGIVGIPILTSGAQSILGASHPIASIAMGDVYDTQRRRRNAFQETYQELEVGTFA